MYQIVYRAIATKEYIDAIKWYEERSTDAAQKFIKSVVKS